MKLNENQLKEIDEKGYLIIPDCFSNQEVNNLYKAMTTVFNEKTEANIVEKSPYKFFFVLYYLIRSYKEKKLLQ